MPAIGDASAIKLIFTDIDNYVNARRKTVKDNTIRREIVDIKAILNWSVKRRPPLIPYNPIRDYPAPQADDDVITPPTSEEAQAIMQYANERLLRAIKISWYTGLRPGAIELLSLTWANVLWDRGVIRSILNPWKQAMAKAGITRRLRPYDLRHLFVTRAIEAGIDYKTLSDIVGSSPETLRKHYQHVSNEARRKAISIMPKFVEK